MVPGDHHDDRIGQHLHEPGEMRVRRQNRRIGGTHCMKHVARNDDHIGPQLDDRIDRLAKRRCHIGFALVQPCRRLTLILAKSEMQIREMDELHRAIPAFRC